MSVVDALLKIAVFRLEQAEQQRTLVAARLQRLLQSRHAVEADLQQLQQRYMEALHASGGCMTPGQLLGLRQIWFETVERQKLVRSIDEQLDALAEQKRECDSAVRQEWARKASLERALELRQVRAHLERLRQGYAQADELWGQHATQDESEEICA